MALHWRCRLIGKSAVLKTAVRKDLGVRVSPPPLNILNHMKYFTYILQSKKDHRYYIGSTADLDRRLMEHNSGKTQSLRYRRPLFVIYFETFNTRAEAEGREKQIKSYKGGRAFKSLIDGSSSRP